MTAKVLQFAKGTVSAMQVLGNGISQTLKKKNKIGIAGVGKGGKKEKSWSANLQEYQPVLVPGVRVEVFRTEKTTLENKASKPIFKNKIDR